MPEPKIEVCQECIYVYDGARSSCPYCNAAPQKPKNETKFIIGCIALVIVGLILLGMLVNTFILP